MSKTISDEQFKFYAKCARECIKRRGEEEVDELLEELTEITEKERTDLPAEAKELFDECHKLMEKKNGDYATDEDQFKSFKMVELLDVPVEQGILTRFLDKVSRLTTLYKENCAVVDQEQNLVEDESFQDTIKDAINYLAILHVYLQQEADR